MDFTGVFAVLQIPMTPQVQLTLTILSFVLGACVGSFLNVVIYRLPLNLSVGNPKRSFCPNCKYQIPFYHNIPLLSWLLLRGKCANCGKPISPRYFFVELLTAFAFLLVWLLWRDQPWKVIPMWIVVSLCISATYIDLDHMIIPDQITYGGAAAGLLCSAIFPGLIDDAASRLENLAQSAIGAVSGLALVFLVVQLGKLAFGRLRHTFATPTAWQISQPNEEEPPVFKVGHESHSWEDIFSRRSDKLRIACQSFATDGEDRGPGTLTVHLEKACWQPEGAQEPTEIGLETVQKLTGTTTSAVVPREAMGLGDVKFMAFIGAFTGWKGVLFTLFGGSIIGSVVAAVMLAARRREWAARIPFGPYLAAAALIWISCGPVIVDWYLHLSMPGATEWQR